MAFTPFGFDVNIHTKLGDDPNVDNNLTADEIKALFDSPMVAFKQYINEVLIPALDSFAPESSMAAFVQTDRPEYFPCLWFRPNATGAYDINFIASNGTAYNIVQNIADNSVTSSKIAVGAVSENKLADGAVTGVKLADGAITTAKIANGQITDAKLNKAYMPAREQMLLIDGVHYGTELPAPGTPGRLFFKKVT